VRSLRELSSAARGASFRKIVLGHDDATSQEKLSDPCCLAPQSERSSKVIVSSISP
jgi:hypothetical protein